MIHCDRRRLELGIVQRHLPRIRQNRHFTCICGLYPERNSEPQQKLPATRGTGSENQHSPDTGEAGFDTGTAGG